MKGVLLISTGIDSPVAGYLMMKQGVEVVGVHFKTLNSQDTKVISELVAHLSKLSGKKMKSYVIPKQEFHDIVDKNCDPHHHCVLCKRFLYMVAEKIAEKEGAEFIITGESMGQVASQTLDNLLVLSDATKLPIMRPLIGFDKEDTIKIARQAGTYEISSQAKGSCPYVPNKPSTSSKKEKILIEESKINLEELVKKAVDEAVILK